MITQTMCGHAQNGAIGNILTRKRVELSQVDQCFDILRGMIVRCEIAPGARLTEKDLIARLGFGRTPVREALLRLSQDRIVDTRPRSGYRVRPLTYKSVDDFLTAWRAVAPLLAELAYRNMKDEDREILSQLGTEGKQLDPDDVEGYRRVSSKFFDHLTRIADSEPLAFIHNRFGAEMDRVFRIFFPTPEGREWIANYTGLENWARSNSPKEAAALISDALARVHRILLSYITASLARGETLFTSEASSNPKKLSRRDPNA
jgi:DNA-binding GntR family transcriptional regulator